MFNIKKGEIVSIVGAGGKSTLLHFLSEKYGKDNRVLLTTTTKINYPPNYDYLFHSIDDILVMEKPLKNGIYVVAPKYKEKLSGLSNEELDKIRKYFDYIFIEADGARMKLLKGWNETEPVIYDKTTITVGVVNKKLLGSVISGENIHRVDKFCQLIGKQVGDTLEEEDFQKIIYNSKGLFKNARGRKYVYYPLENKYTHIGSYNKISAIILASGFSNRMGRNKLLLPINNLPMIEHLFKVLENLGFLEVIVVTQYERVKILAKKYGFTPIINNDATKGISESIRLGVNYADTESNLMFFNGDQPYLRKETIEKIINSRKEDSIIVPTIDGRRKSPVLFSNKFREELLQLVGDVGGRQVIQNNGDKVVEVEFKDIDDFIDIDSVEEYEKH
jgi:probable selenium-dependent hydroxylase accessory protein YqeC